MALLAEYALTPDVFDSTSYSNNELGRERLLYLKEVLLNEGIVRNLRDGVWLNIFSKNLRPWHLKGKELLRKLAEQQRLRSFPSVLPDEPDTDDKWCHEALASHGQTPMAGIVTTQNVARHFPREPLVASIDRLRSAPWWAARSQEVRLERTRAAYEENLRLILQCANSLMFIDPHLDPSKPRYGDIVSLLGNMARRTPHPLIEIHRVHYSGSGQYRQEPTELEWRNRFNTMRAVLLASSLTAEVYVWEWEHFHDRYLISDLIGIQLGNGFDTRSGEITTWTRLGRQGRDDIQREFDPASYRHTLRYRFTLP